MRLMRVMVGFLITSLRSLIGWVCLFFLFFVLFCFVLFCFVLFCFVLFLFLVLFCFYFLFHLHVDTICKKSSKIIGFIHRSFQSAPSNIRRTLYLALVRLILEFGSDPDWTAWGQSELRTVILQSWNLSHEDLLQDSNLPPLNKPRDVASLCHLYKMFSSLSSSLIYSGLIPNLICAISIPVQCQFHSTGWP